MKVEYQVIYWRDVPAQLRVRRGRERVSRQLPDRFQKTVYRAAYRGKAITGDPFRDGWRPGPWQPYDGNEQELPQIAAVLATDLDDQYDDERLNNLALNKGHSPL